MKFEFGVWEEFVEGEDENGDDEANEEAIGDGAEEGFLEEVFGALGGVSWSVCIYRQILYCELTTRTYCTDVES